MQTSKPMGKQTKGTSIPMPHSSAGSPLPPPASLPDMQGRRDATVSSEHTRLTGHTPSHEMTGSHEAGIHDCQLNQFYPHHCLWLPVSG